MSTSQPAQQSGAATTLVTLQDIQQAHERVAPYTHYTPLFTSQAIDALATAELLQGLPCSVRLAFKAEHLQRVGAFKYRGATNAVLRHLDAARADYVARGFRPEEFSPAQLVVVTHSSGNHAAALACAAASAGSIAAVVMPENAPKPKQDAVAGYGARITLCTPTLEARESTAKQVMRSYSDQGYIVRFVHPYDERLVIAGQGTMALEMLDQIAGLEQHPGAASPLLSSVPPTSRPTVGVYNPAACGPKADGIWTRRPSDQPPLDIVIAPVGGGGMLSGVSTAIKGVDERIIVVGAEPDRVNDAFHSLRSGTVQMPAQPPRTLCDGLLTSLSALTLAHIQKNVDTISTAREENILHALHLHWTRQKQLVEPSAAVGLAIVLQGHNEAGRSIDQNAADSPALRGVRDWVRQTAQKRIDQGDVHPEIRIGVIWSGGNVEVSKVADQFRAAGL